VTARFVVQYVGYQAKADVREYSFLVRGSSGDPRQFFLSIANEAFAAHLVRFQDAAEICMIRLQQELAALTQPARTEFRVSEADLAAYRAAHAPKPRPRFPSRKTFEE
jgi:hypothetical protein